MAAYKRNESKYLSNYNFCDFSVFIYGAVFGSSEMSGPNSLICSPKDPMGTIFGPKQHFAHSIFRAIENGKYVVRASNNGMAAIINPLGQVEKKINTDHPTNLLNQF